MYNEEKSSKHCLTYHFAIQAVFMLTTFLYPSITLFIYDFVYKEWINLNDIGYRYSFIPSVYWGYLLITLPLGINILLPTLSNILNPPGCLLSNAYVAEHYIAF